MGILTSAILSACLSTPGDYAQACSKVVQQGGQQSGISQDIDKYEAKFIKDLNNSTVEEFGENGKYALESGLYLASAVAGKKINLSVPNMGISDKMTAQISLNTYMLLLQWRF